MVCLAAVPSALPAAAFAKLPAWAQRSVPLGYDLRGGAGYQLQVDAYWVRHWRLEELRDDARRILREARIGYAHMTIRNDGVEFWVREADDMPRVLTGLEAFKPPVPRPGTARPAASDGRPSLTAISGTPIPPPEIVIDVADRMVRLSVTEDAIRARITEGRDRAMQWIGRRFAEMGQPYTLTRVGTDRLYVSSYDPHERWRQFSY